jgi:WD40 repeat protein
MSMADCKDLYKEMEEIAVLRRLADEAVKDAALTGNAARAKELSEQLKVRMAELKVRVEQERKAAIWPDPFYHPKNIGRVEKKENYREMPPGAPAALSLLAIQVLPDGSIVVGGESGRMSVLNKRGLIEWDTDIVSYQGQPLASVRTLQALPDGRIISSGDFPEVSAMTNEGGRWKKKEMFKVFGSEVLSVRALRDGRVITANNEMHLPWQLRYLGRRLSTVRAWKEGENGEWKEQMLPGHKDGTTTLDVLPDGRLVTGGKDGEVHVLEEHGKKWRSDTIRAVARPDLEDSNYVRIHALNDGRILSAGSDGHICIWNEESGALPNGEIFHEWRSTKVGSTNRWPTDVQMLPDERVVVSVSNPSEGAGEENFIVFKKDEKGDYHESERIGEGGKMIKCFQVLPDGRIVSAGADGAVRIWDGDKVESKQKK